MSRRSGLIAVVVAALAALALSATASAAPSCNGVPKRGCLLPFPNDFAQTKADTHDADRPPGRLRCAPPMPANKCGKRIDPREWNRNDGFSPGQPIIVHVPSLKTPGQLPRSGIVPVNDLAKYTEPRQPLLLLDEKTGKRQIVWGELDADEAADHEPPPDHPPGQEPRAGRRYVVVLRNLQAHRAPRGPVGDDLAGAPRRRATAGSGASSQRRTSTWDFTVASDKSLTARLLKHPRRRVRASSATRTWPTASSRAARRATRSPSVRTSRRRRTRRSRARSPARSPCPATSTSPAARRARASLLQLEPDALPTQIAGNVTRRPSSATSRAPRSRARRAIVALRPRPARRRTRRSTRTTSRT